MEETPTPNVPRRLVSAGFLFNCRGKYLLCKPSHRTSSVGGWAIAKGRRDKFETLFETAVREFREETGVNVLATDIQHETLPWFSYVTEGSDKKGAYIKTVYVFRAYTTKRKYLNYKFSCSTNADDGRPEIADYCWVHADDAIDMVIKTQKDMFRFISNFQKDNVEGLIDNVGS